MTQVLVAEDVAAISLCLEDALVESGYTVAGSFHSGSSVMVWLWDNTPDLAVLDLRLVDGPCIEVPVFSEAGTCPCSFSQEK